MSIIFGILQPEGDFVGHEQLLGLAGATEHLAPDGAFLHREANIGLGIQPFYTTDRSRGDRQPGIDGQRNAVLIDGRLDNHEELRSNLGIANRNVSDSDLILCSFARWGEDCFAHLCGEWAVVLWNHAARKLYLARDHAGTRPLHFTTRGQQVLWSTTPHALVRDESGRKISPQFAARFLTGKPTWDLTPFESLQAIRPAHCVVFSGNSARSILHWCPAGRKPIPLRTSHEYDQRFLELFRIAVQRRISAEPRILAELSGGMDSSAIVCIADQFRDPLSAPAIDTLSFFDDSEPHWNERPYFAEVERRRGRKGIQIDLSETHRRLDLRGGTPEALLSPMLDCGRAQLETMIRNQLGPLPHRIILSGYGGDELLGGVPAPIPELVELLASARLSALLTRGTEWSIRTRTPMSHLLWRTIRTVAGVYLRPARPAAPPPWIRPGLMRFLGSSVSSRGFLLRDVHWGGPAGMIRREMWWSLADNLPHSTPSSRLHLEYRYPYLDRDLVEFLLSVPRHELCAPGRRRLMMRRALKDIVPEMILDRPRKAYISRRPLALIRNSIVEIEELFAASRMADHGFLDPGALRVCLATALEGETRWMRLLLATIAYEVWLRNLEGEFKGSQSGAPPAKFQRPQASMPARTAAGRHG